MARYRRFWELAQLVVIAGMFITAGVRWGSVPDRIPIHWNAAGQVDGYGGKFAALLLPPLITLGLYLLLRYLPRIDPARRNYESFADTYLLVRVTLTGYLAFMYLVANLAIGREESVPVGALTMGAVGVLFIVLGGVMGKFRPNWFVGIRTPWTLSSKRSWIETHRVGGRVFIGVGLVTLLGALVGGTWSVALMLVALGIGVVYLIVYSYVVWKHDPDKVPAQEVTPAGEERHPPPASP